MTRFPIDCKKSNPGLCRFACAALIMLAPALEMNVFQAQARSSGPRVVVSEIRHDFGDVFAGQFMDHVFTIRNEGSSPLTLSDVVPHTPNASVYKPATHRTLADRLARRLAGLFPLNAVTTNASSFMAANAREAGSSGPPRPAPT